MHVQVPSQEQGLQQHSWVDAGVVQQPAASSPAAIMMDGYFMFLTFLSLFLDGKAKL